MNYDFSTPCTLCPRNCGAVRTQKSGFCGANDKLNVAKVSVHNYEEPVISGTNGSGTVFFSHCNLKCVFCQNYQISTEGFGKEITVERLAEIFREVESHGVHNINLVNPTHYVPQIAEALSIANPSIPVVYNSSGYEKPSSLDIIDPYVDIYLPDFKYADCDLSNRLSGAKDYPEVALRSIEYMLDKKPKVIIKDGIMKSGVMIRHLVLPSHSDDSVKVMDILGKLKGDFLISVMSQYTPLGKAENFPDINRTITPLEYKRVLLRAEQNNLDNGFMQELDSAGKDAIPTFDLSGV